MSQYPKHHLFIVGYGGKHHIGAHFMKAARDMGLETQLCDNQQAFDASWLHRQISWRLCGHRPPRLETVSREVLGICKTEQPYYLLVTGMMALHAQALHKIKQQKTLCFNYLTDDPWNRTHGSKWFRDSLPEYDMVFSPRQSNLADLQALGCRVTYLPFGYEPTLHFPEEVPQNRQSEFACDVLFYGGADKDRLPYARAILQAGYNLHLYGGYWDRDPITRRAWRGFANPQTLRWAVSGAKVTLCLVRRANRDGHVMRTFEVPAMGGSMLTEDTPEHRQILGETVVYFRGVDDMLDKLPTILNDEIARKQLATRAHQHILSGGNRYMDRLKTMLETLDNNC